MKKSHPAILFLIAAAILLTQCKSLLYSAKVPGDAELSAAKTKWPDVTMESLKDGYSVYTTKCTECHKLKPVPRFTEPEWDGYINKMAPKAKLTPTETENLRRYIFTERSLVEKK